MSSLVVVGAGPIGAALVHEVVAAGLTRRVTLVDDNLDVARGLALDIRQAGAIAGSSTIALGTSDAGAAIGATVIVVADRHGPAGEWQGEAGLARVATLRGLNPEALIICAGATQAGLVETLVRERHFDRRRLVGSAPEALRSALTALVCLETDTAARDVSLVALGRPPKQMFVPWEGASVGGARAVEVVAPTALARIDRQVPYLWPPGPLALAAAAAGVVQLVVRHTPGWVCLFAVPDTDAGNKCVSAPACVQRGVVDVRWPVLSPRDQVRLESALAG